MSPEATHPRAQSLHQNASTLQYTAAAIFLDTTPDGSPFCTKIRCRSSSSLATDAKTASLFSSNILSASAPPRPSGRRWRAPPPPLRRCQVDAEFLPAPSLDAIGEELVEPGLGPADSLMLHRDRATSGRRFRYTLNSVARVFFFFTKRKKIQAPPRGGW